MLNSIKSKLIAWYLFVLSVIFTGLGFFFYFELEKILIGSIDGHLHSEIQLLAGMLEQEGDYLEIETSEASVGEFSVPLSGHYFQVVSSDGKVLARSPSLSIVDAFLPMGKESLTPFYETGIGPEKGVIRMLTQSFRLPTGTVTIHASEPLEESYSLLNSFRNAILFFIPCVFLFSTLGIWVATVASLKKLNRFSKRVSRISEKSLSQRIESKGLEMELKPLAEDFNSMLGRLEAAFSRQKEFLSNASHELRTPVSIVKSDCEVTLARERSLPEYREALERIAEVVNGMAAVVNKIMEASRLDSGAFSLNPVPLNLAKMMKEMVASLQPFAARHEVELFVKGEEIFWKGDREKILEAFTNLVENGIKYNKPGGRVDVLVAEEKEYVRVEVSDTGIGIPEEERKNIFDRFYRVDRSGAVGEGCGLGLSITRSIVEVLGGRIKVESEPGKGSRFVVSLPRV